MTPPVRGRFAPTPSGRMHLGNVFSCLMAWLGAKSSGGSIVLRIEDLDPRANNPAVAQQLIDDLAWLGLTWDEGPIFQSERTAIYREALGFLADNNLLYPCFCTRSELHAASAPHASDGSYLYPGTCRNLTSEQIEQRQQTRSPALRVRVPAADDPAGTIDVYDAVYGLQHEVLARDCGDFLVQRSDGVIAYQLAVVIDDALMGVNQVVRGRDLLSSSARQTWLAQTLGYSAPTFAHVPLLIAEEGRRLSKRDHDTDLGKLRAHGATPERIFSALAAEVGLIERGTTCSLHELLAEFSWKTVAQHHYNILVSDGLVANMTKPAG